MRKILLALAFVFMAAWAIAQTAPTLYWEHDGASVTYFDCAIDGGTAVSLGLPTPSGSTYSSALSNCGTMAAGTHTLVIRACNSAGCTAGRTIYVVKL